MSAIPTFKCVLIGNARAGKSAFLAAHMGAAVPREYSATLGVNVAPLVFATPDGKQKIRFNVWDCAGDPKFEGLGMGYYVGADCAIIAIDASTSASPSWWQTLLPATIPFAVISTHADMLPTVPVMTAAPHTYYVSSTKALGILAPFTDLARRLANIDLDPPSVDEPSPTDKFVDPKTIDIRAIMRNYRTAYITVAVSEFETVGKELRARSGMEVDGANSPVYIATFPDKVIDEFLAINGIVMNYAHGSSDGIMILNHILQYMKLPATHVHVTKEFINNLDVLLFEFIIKRTTQLRGILRETEHIYRDAIEKIAASTSTAIQDARNALLK